MLAILAKKKGKGKAMPSASKVAANVRYDLTGLPSVIIVVGSALYGVPLETNIRVPLEPIGSSRCSSHKSLRLVNEEAKKGKDDEGVPFRTQVRRRYEASDAVKVSFKEGTQSIEPLKVPRIAPEVVESSGSSDASLSLKGLFELLRKRMVGKPMFNSLKALTTLARALSLSVKDVATPYFCTKEALFLSLRCSLKVRLRHTSYYYFSFCNS